MGNRHKPDISIVIVNYKSWKHLKNSLNSLLFASDRFSFETIVVDNHSNDGILDSFTKDFPNVKFVSNTGNNGFANGCNFGASHALADYLLFLNPDTIANEKAIYEMFEFAKKNPTVGIVSCEQKKSTGGYEKNNRIFLKFFTLFGLFRVLYKWFNQKDYKNLSTQDQLIYPDWVSGSVVCISNEWFHQIEGWNEDYWMYYEDMDLCRRVYESNGKVALLKDVEIIHNHGGASRINMKTSSLTKTEVQISKHIYISNHFKDVEKFIAQFLLILNNVIFKFLLAILGVLLFFVPKMRLNVYLFTKIISYYGSVLFRMSWLSKNSMNTK